MVLSVEGEREYTCNSGWIENSIGSYIVLCYLQNNSLLHKENHVYRYCYNISVNVVPSALLRYFPPRKEKVFPRKKMVGLWYGWFSDYCLLNVMTQNFHAYPWRKQVQQYKNNYTEVKEESENQSNDLWLPLEMYRELHRSEQMLPYVAATMCILFFVVYYRGLWRT